MNLEEMRGIARHIKREMPGVRDVVFTVSEHLLMIEVKMADGGVFYDGMNMDKLEPELAEPVMKAFCDGLHQFVLEHRRSRGADPWAA